MVEQEEGKAIEEFDVLFVQNMKYRCTKISVTGVWLMIKNLLCSESLIEGMEKTAKGSFAKVLMPL